MSEIAETDEIRQFLTQVMRGEQIEGAERIATLGERLKALELLGKTTGLWANPFGQKQEPVEFYGDDLLED